MEERSNSLSVNVRDCPRYIGVPACLGIETEDESNVVEMASESCRGYEQEPLTLRLRQSR
jgi:hypothetical protein